METLAYDGRVEPLQHIFIGKDPLEAFAASIDTGSAIVEDNLGECE